MVARNACRFCLIRDGELPAAFVLRDEATFAIMDGRQPGWPDVAHIIVMPLDHVEVIDDLSSDQAARLMQSVVQIAAAVRTAFRPQGLSLWQSNNEAGGQEVPHVHMHVLTRKVGDALVRIYPDPPSRPGLDAMKPTAATIRAELARFEASSS